MPLSEWASAAPIASMTWLMAACSGSVASGSVRSAGLSARA
ncbi:hypothetical protein [Microtetraspora niveoalba]|nr:hypothetical protein [Microtetraspora niveoalba]